MDISKLEDAEYMNENSLTSLESLPEGCYPALVAAANEAGFNGEPGIGCEVAVTHETLADFENSRTAHWAECKDHDLFAECSIYYGVQIRKGNQRKTIAVVDCGDLRAVLSS